MNLFDNATEAEPLVGYTVVDQDHETIGDVECVWTDEVTGDIEFLGVDTSWFSGKSHVIPVSTLQVDAAKEQIVAPYSVAFVKDAPSFMADATISSAEEDTIFSYYGVARRTPESAAGTGGHTVETTGDNVEIPLKEEEVKVGKRTVQTGAVRLRKVVRTEVVNRPVELQREEVIVERVPAGEVSGDAGTEWDEKSIEVPIREEEAVVSKEAHVTGAVRVRKDTEVETEEVSETIRKEDVEVDRDGSTHR